jgi:HEAT repeat protein
MNTLKDRVSALNALAMQRPTPDNFGQVRDALEDKWEGVQSAGLKVLGAWGDGDSCKLLQAFLVGAFERPYGWSIRGVAVAALRPHISKHDVDWVLDLYFGLTGFVRKHEVRHLVFALPAEAARDRLVNALRDDHPHNRQAAVKAIGNMDYPDRLSLISPLKEDPDDFVRRSAQVLTRTVD